MYGPKALAKLQQKKYREQYGCFLVEGKRGVLDAVRSRARVLQLVVSNEFVRTCAEYCQQPAIAAFFEWGEIVELREAELSRLLDSTAPQGIAAVVEIPQRSLAELTTGNLVVVYEDIRDPGNLGTMIRTADWFGASGVVLLGGADPYQPKVVRSSMGSLFQVPVMSVSSEHSTDVLQDLQRAGYSIVVTRPELDQDPTTPLVLPHGFKLAVVFGNEAHGTSAATDDLADQSLTIPRYGQAESLNVAVSCGIVLYALRSR